MDSAHESFSIEPARLHAWVSQLWQAAGCSAQEAELTADHLVQANLTGHDSHGVGMVPRYVKSWAEGALQLNQHISVVHDGGALLTLDAHQGMGPALAHEAMALAIERAQANGVCVMGLRNSHHLGRVGHWAEQAVAQGLVAIHFTNAVSNPASVAPHGGRSPRFITNPFTVGIPRGNDDPLVLDFATSAIAHGKVRVAYNKGVAVPEGSLIDGAGRATNDPAVLFEPAGAPQGALLPFAGHKGYALAMVCELLGAALTGGPTTRPEHMTMQWAVWNNMLAIVFDPKRIGGDSAVAHFEHEAREFIAWVQSAPLREGVDAILVPGDPERHSRAARAQGIPIDAGTLQQLHEAQATVEQRSGRRLAALI